MRFVNKYKYFSFDIFDTCLIRKCGEANTVFDILAYRILGEGMDDSLYMDFSNERIRGEEKARKEIESEEISLNDIYDYCNFHGITDVDKKLIAETEQLIEYELLVPVKTVKNKIDYIRSHGGCIIYISDMYLFV